MDSTSLPLQNPWWAKANTIEADQHLMAIAGKPYRFEPAVVSQLQFGSGDIHILRGPRQVGKTTALKMLIRRLLTHNIPPERIFYLSCESFEKFQELEKILAVYLRQYKADRTYLFLDEISFVTGWQRAVLAIANMGLTQNACLVLTGSNARDLKESSERLPGRRGMGKDLHLFPLSLKDLGGLECFRGKPFSELLEIYLRVGGFPRAIADFASLGTVTDTTYEIYRNWIAGDATRYELRQETLKQILFRIAETLATRVTWPKLNENSPVKSHETALEYAEHLKDSFLCHIHYCYDPDTLGPAFQKARKIYFIDPLLYAIAVSWREGTTNVFQWIDGQLKDKSLLGNMFEAVVINHAARLYPHVFFWYSAKEKKEVDLVVKKEKDIALYEAKLKANTPFKALNRLVQIIDPISFEDFLSRSHNP